MTEWLNQKQYAEKIGVSPSAINQRMQRGHYKGCTRKKGRLVLINFEKAKKMDRESLDMSAQIGGMATQRKHGKIPKDEESDLLTEQELLDKAVSDGIDGMGYKEAQRLEMIYRARVREAESRMKQADADLAEGKTVDAAETQSEITAKNMAAKQALEGMGFELGPILAPIDDEIKIAKIIEQKVFDILTELSKE